MEVLEKIGHTNGEWIFRKGKSSVFTIFCRVNPFESLVIASVHAPATPDNKVQYLMGKTIDFNFEECKRQTLANAKLIASAPDLLRVLVGLVENPLNKELIESANRLIDKLKTE